MAVREVQVKNGKIHGCASGIPTVSVFKGIPYAAAPVGGAALSGADGLSGLGRNLPGRGIWPYTGAGSDKNKI